MISTTSWPQLPTKPKGPIDPTPDDLARLQRYAAEQEERRLREAEGWARIRAEEEQARRAFERQREAQGRQWPEG